MTPKGLKNQHIDARRQFQKPIVPRLDLISHINDQRLIASYHGSFIPDALGKLKTN